LSEAEDELHVVLAKLEKCGQALGHLPAPGPVPAQSPKSAG
jgi:hypothetical protein